MVERYRVGKRMSQVVRHGNTLYIAGQVADDPKAPIEVQTQEVLRRIEVLLAEAGRTKSDLLFVTVYLPHITDFEAMNRVYDAWIDPNHPPARACVEARLADPDLRIEITAVGAIQDSGSA